MCLFSASCLPAVPSRTASVLGRSTLQRRRQSHVSLRRSTTTSRKTLWLIGPPRTELAGQSCVPIYGSSRAGRFGPSRPIGKNPRHSRTRRRTMSSGLIDTNNGVPPALEDSPAVLPPDGTAGHRWAVVLAGGDGTRL